MAPSKIEPLVRMAQWACSLALLWHAPLVQSQQMLFIDRPALYFVNTYNLEIGPNAATRFEDFISQGSQLHILIGRHQFPIAAPNCEGPINLRFKRIEAVAGLTTESQQARWELMQLIRHQHGADNTPVLLPVETRQHMKRLDNGQYELLSCDVWVE